MIEAKAKAEVSTGLCECNCEINGTIKEILPEFFAIAKAVYDTIRKDKFAELLFLSIMKNFDEINEKMMKESKESILSNLSKNFTEVFNDESKHQQD